MAATPTSTAPPARIIPSGGERAQPDLPSVLGSQRLFHRDHRRPITSAPGVHSFMYRPPIIPRQEEKAQYDLHENDPYDLGYRKFLSRLTDPLLAKLPPQPWP